MKERPILFNTEMVRAILVGKKTQTRRIVKPQPIQPCEGAYFDAYNKGQQWNWWTKDDKQCLDQIIKCPFGKPGDRLWVRETWAVNSISQGWKRNRELAEDVDLSYRADGEWKDQFEQIDGDCPPWRPSIHMPRKASRINLEITNIKVERLQDISGIDAIAEGIQEISKYGKSADISDFQNLWESINGDGSWDANPWVWVIEFKRVK